MEVVKRQEPPYEVTEYITPIGACSIKLIWSVNEGPWLAYEHEKLFKSKKDLSGDQIISLTIRSPYLMRSMPKSTRTWENRGIVTTVRACGGRLKGLCARDHGVRKYSTK